MRIALKLLA